MKITYSEKETKNMPNNGCKQRLLKVLEKYLNFALNNPRTYKNQEAYQTLDDIINEVEKCLKMLNKVNWEDNRRLQAEIYARKLQNTSR